MWAMGFVERPSMEYQIYRYKSLRSAGISLAQIMAIKSNGIKDALSCAKFLRWLERLEETDFDNNDSQLAFCELPDIMFVIGLFENITNVKGEASYRIIQDHRACSRGFCFGDIAERN